MADENIIVRITGEADLQDAQNQVRELTQRNKELENEMKALATAMKQDEADIRAMGLGEKELSAALQKNAQYYKQQKQELQNVTQANNQSIASLKKSVNQYNMLSGVGNKARQQLTALREEMVRMAEAGDTTSARFIEMSEQAAALSDTIGDAQKVIQLMSSDTKNLDAAMAVGGGLIGTFNTATSAMALLGGESEALQDAFLKVQAAMSVLNGIQSVANVVDKRSAANIVLRTALQKVYNKTKIGEAVATGTATKAQLLFNKAVMANPVGALIAVVAAAAAAIAYFAGKAKDATGELNAMNAEFESTKRLMSDLERLGNLEANIASVQGATEMEVLQLRKKNADEAYNAAYKSEQEILKIYLDASGKKRDDLKAKLDEATALTEEARKKQRDIEDQITVQEYKDRKAADDAADKDRKERAEQRLKEEQESFAARMQMAQDAAEEEYAIFNDMEKKRREELQREQKLERDAKAALAKVAEEEAAEEQAYSDEVEETDRENWEEMKRRHQETIDETIGLISDVLGTLRDITDEVFGMMTSQIDAQIEELDTMYTTDAKLAQEDASKKLITEKELEKKKAELQMKRAKYSKAQALVDIAIQTTLATMAEYARSGWVGAALAAAAGTAALIAAAAKPLAQYAKGRKGGPGEYALVGEKGPEIMYVPQGASIVPNDKLSKPGSWEAYGVPQLPIPARASFDNMALKEALSLYGGQIDYDRLGKAVAANIPAQKAVSVNVDRSGVTVRSGNDTRTYLNTKYLAKWN